MKCKECNNEMVEKFLFTSTYHECDFCIGRAEQLSLEFPPFNFYRQTVNDIWPDFQEIEADSTNGEGW